MSKTKGLLFAAGFALAMVFTLSCSGDDGGGVLDNPILGEEPSSSSGDEASSSSGNDEGGKVKNSAGLTYDGHDLLVFNPGVLDDILIKIDTTAISDTSFIGTLHFANLKPEQIPEAGDIVNSGSTKSAPYGFLYKIISVSIEDGITKATVEYASIKDAIEEMELDQEIDFMFDKEGNLERVLLKDYSGTPGMEFKAEKEITVAEGVKISAAAGYKITLDWKVRTGWKYWVVPTLEYAHMVIKQEKNLHLVGDVKASVDRAIVNEIARVNLPSIDIWAGIWINIQPKVFAQTKISGNANVSLDIEYKYEDYSEHGFKYQGGRISPVSANRSNESFDFNQSISGTVRVGVLVGIDISLYGTLGFTLATGPALQLSASTDGLTGIQVYDQGFEKARPVISLDLGFDFELGAYFKIWGWTIVDYTYNPGFAVTKNLARADLFPSFDNPQVSYGGTSGIEVKSAIRKHQWGFPVNNYGICVEKSKDECKNGGGTRKTFGGIADEDKHEFSAVIDDLEASIYNIRPYFESYLGTYYDKAVEFRLYPDLIDSRDGQAYKITVIGTQTWMAQNLNYNVPGSKCYGEGGEVNYDGSGDNNITLSYSEIQANCAKYGRMYDWATAMGIDTSYNRTQWRGSDENHRGICPEGWYVSSRAEWDTLVEFVGGKGVAGTKLSAQSGWSDFEGKAVSGTDDYGFAALPGGRGNGLSLIFDRIGTDGTWLTATEERGSMYNPFIILASGYDMVYSGSKNNFYSLRCLKDD